MKINNSSYNLMLQRAIINKDLIKYYEIKSKYEPIEELSFAEKLQEGRREMQIKEIKKQQQKEAEMQIKAQISEFKEELNKDIEKTIEEVLNGK